MTRTARLSPLVLFAALLALAPAAVRAEDPSDAAGTTSPKFVRLTYDTVIEHEVVADPEHRDASFEPRVERRQAITLGPRIFEVDASGTRAIVDFEAGVATTIDDTQGTYESHELLQSVGFLDTEMRNRVKMRNALAAASVTDPSLEPRELSALFGWKAAGDESVASFATGGDGEVVFSLDGDEFARWRLSATALDDAQQASFSRFLQMRAHLHPEALRRLVASGVAPAMLRARWKNVGQSNTATWTLVDATPDAPPPRGIATQTKAGVVSLERTYGTSELAQLAARVIPPDGRDAPGPPNRERFAASAAEASEAGRHDDAMLLLLESSLSNGDEMRAEIERTIQAPGAQELVRSLMRAIALASAQPTTSLELLDKIDRTRLTRPHVLDIFKANALTSAGRRGEAKDLLLATLSEVPYLTAAYKDLGDLYYSEFLTEDAWLAWEMGRRLAPEHGCWKQIEAYEARLRKTYAERL